ncbi:MAG: hypothetical protein QHC67_17855 [Sphingobium sp.]|uniref:hypothetical protein n=1 Tax=Sphingobium sp. TaxID=1912891 RepID=UPI0029BD17BC|nr:hypothetical protein [Sphingobium sp.]MDX3911649.1 hypothetical protein [Sphingobium sp.]
MVSREELYQLVWSEPMTKIAARFGVSGSYLARICTMLNVPRPERGYWAKLAVGKAPLQPSLPDALPCLRRVREIPQHLFSEPTCRIAIGNRAVKFDKLADPRIIKARRRRNRVHIRHDRLLHRLCDRHLIPSRGK